MPTARAPLQLHTTADQAVEIALEAFPGAGALWRAPEAPAGCSLVEGERRAGASGGVGGPVQQCFAFTASRPGRYTLEFAFGQPWSPEVRALQPVWVVVA